MGAPPAADHPSALQSAVHKAYVRLLPLLFICYVVAYVDRANVAIAKLKMQVDLPLFDNNVIGTGAGIFFLGYFVLSIPSSLLVELGSARRWIARFMVTWGVLAALTAAVKTPLQFYLVRFGLGLAEAGFFPGVVVYLTHWFPARDRARALALFMSATPLASVLSPKICNAFLMIGMDEKHGNVLIHHPALLGLHGWQWIFVVWGLPALVLGLAVSLFLADRPGQATWLTAAEREALDAELERDRSAAGIKQRMTLSGALVHPKVLLLAAAYLCAVTASYGMEFFLPSILQRWYRMAPDAITSWMMLPPLLAFVGQIAVGWSSDRMRERRWHTTLPLLVGGLALMATPSLRAHLGVTIVCFMLAYAGFKSYIPSFWSLPSLFLSQAAAAGAIGFINMTANLGGFLGPKALGKVETLTGSFVPGLYFLASSMLLASVLVWRVNLGGRARVPARRLESAAESDLPAARA